MEDDEPKRAQKPTDVEEVWKSSRFANIVFTLKRSPAWASHTANIFLPEALRLIEEHGGAC
jgi:hypothetical protein